jgi:ribonuclease P protein component
VLRRGRDFGAVLREGRRTHRERVVVYVRPAVGGPRAGFVAGRAVGGAVKRNRARRVMREAWRLLRPRAHSGIDVVFQARGTMRDAKTHEVLPEMEDALVSLGALEA